MSVKLQFIFLSLLVIVHLAEAYPGQRNFGDPNSQGAKDFSNKGVALFNKQQTGGKIYQLHKVFEYFSQLVSGILTRAIVEVQQQNCRNDVTCPLKRLQVDYLYKPSDKKSSSFTVKEI